MPIYEITVTRSGVPHETWEASHTTPEAAIAECRAARTVAAEHDDATDTYAAIEHNAECSDRLANVFAFMDAARHLPALYTLGASTW